MAYKSRRMHRTARTMALGLMCLSSFIANPADVLAASPDVTIIGAGGGSGLGSNGLLAKGGDGAKVNYGAGDIEAQRGEGSTGAPNGPGSGLSGTPNGQGATGGPGTLRGGQGHGVQGAGMNFALGGGGGGSNVASGTPAGAGGTTVVTGQAVRVGDFEAAAGTGGLGSDTYTVNGGKGGDVNISLGSLALEGDMELHSGNDGATYRGAGGTGGNLSLIVQRLSIEGGGTQTLTFSKNDGLLSVQVGTLDMSANGAELEFSVNAPGADAVQFNTMRLGASKTLTVSSGVTATSTADLFTFNTLSVLGPGATYSSALPLAASGKTLEFDINGVAAGSPTLLSAPNAEVQMQGSTVRFTPITNSPLAVGESFTLIDNTTGTQANSTVASRLGMSRIMLFSLTKNDNSLKSTFTGTEANPQMKSLSEGQTTALALASMSGDLVAGAGMQSAAAAARTAGANPAVAGGSPGGWGLAPFMAVSASSLRYNTGSHVDVNGMPLMAGLAKTWQLPTTDILVGAFFEGAWGTYTSHNSFDLEGIDPVRGKGRVRGLGGGVLTRLDLKETWLRGLYAEGSVRAGSLSTKYHSNDLRDASGERLSYHTSNAYYGAHVGLGYLWELTDTTVLDLYGKYFWAHQKGNSITVFNDTIDYENTNSHRTRLGSRLTFAALPSLTPYVGAAWEYEFDSKTSATTYGFEVPAPSLKGSTGLGELGLEWNPTTAQNLFVDFGVQGFAGKREGVSGNLQLRYQF